MNRQKSHARVKHRRSFNMRRWIQNNKKAVFVSLTVICMGAFVVGPSLQQFLDQDGGVSGGTRMVEWNGGSLTKYQLEAMQSAESQTQRFLLILVDKTRSKGGNPTDRFGLASGFTRSDPRQLPTRGRSHYHPGRATRASRCRQSPGQLLSPRHPRQPCNRVAPGNRRDMQKRGRPEATGEFDAWEDSS